MKVKNKINKSSETDKKFRRKSNNSRNVKKQRNRLERKSRRSLQKMKCLNRNGQQNASHFSSNQEIVINQVRKLIGDDSIEEYKDYRDDINFLQDLNLLIFSSPPEEYKVYCELLRKEYDYLNDSSYNSMRLKSCSITTDDNKIDSRNVSTPNNNSNVSTNLSPGKSKKKRKRNRSNLSNSINMRNLSGRKLKKHLRHNVLLEEHQTSLSSKKSDDCILIEVPKVIIVIDDDIDINESEALAESNQNSEKPTNVLSVTNNLNNETLLNSNSTLNLNDKEEFDPIVEKNSNEQNTSTTCSNKIDNLTSITLDSTKSNSAIDNDCDNTIISDDSEPLIEIGKVAEDKIINNILAMLNKETIPRTYDQPPIYETSVINSNILGSENNDKYKDTCIQYNQINQDIINANPVAFVNLCQESLLQSKEIENENSNKDFEALSNVTNEEIKSQLESNHKSLRENDTESGNPSNSLIQQVENTQTSTLNEQKNIKRTKKIISPSWNKSNTNGQKVMKSKFQKSYLPRCSNLNNSVIINLDEDEEDESVVFVNEIKLNDSTALDYIPLQTEHEKFMEKKKRKTMNRMSKMLVNPFKRFKNNLESLKNVTSTPTSIKPKSNEIVFTNSEKKKNIKYNSNTFNPNKDDTIKTAEKRMIIIDGSNVAFGHGNSNYFSSRGLEIAINFFETKGHQIKAVVPQFRVNYNRSSDGEKLKELHKAGKIVFTPGKNLPDLKASSYDDRFILQLALEFDAAIVSNDNYRDLIEENPGFKKLIENRVITYAWCNDLFIVAKDPYGKRGPSLDSILNRDVNLELPKLNEENSNIVK